MIVKFLEFITEYLSIILCAHKVAGKRIKFNHVSLFDFVSWAIVVFIGAGFSFGKIFVYTYLYVYIKIRIANTWKQAVKPFIITMCAIPILQLLIYAVISDIVPDIFSIYLWGTIINIFIIAFLTVWKEKYMTALMNIITKYGRVIFLILLFFLIKCLISYFTEYKVINVHSMRQLEICFLLVALMLIFWINSENERRHKAEELRMYKLYTRTFEDAVAAIRMRQHEFDNHINAIKCMRYTIHDIDKLMDEQDKYCERILQENKYNKLLKLKTSPILIGYLYSKFSSALTQGINVDYEIQDINVEKLAINDLIEIIGILLDNAIEALEEQDVKKIEIKLLNSKDAFMISVANISGWKTNSEIEKFFECGYSTKGDGHGIGLYRMNMLIKKYKANIQVENVSKDDLNYLSFKITF